MIDIFIPIKHNSQRVARKNFRRFGSEPLFKRTLLKFRGHQIFVDTDSQEIIDVIKRRSGIACMTSENHQTGTDRMHEALRVIDPGKMFHYIINLQGDLPTINSMALEKVLNLLSSEEDEIGTLVTQFEREEDLKKEQFVKAVCNFSGSETESYAENFVRKQGDYDSKNLFHHIGIYSFKRDALEKFVTLSQTDREKNEKLEQLRALDNNMKIKIGLIDFLPLGVDTPEDLEEIRKILSE